MTKTLSKDNDDKDKISIPYDKDDKSNQQDVINATTFIHNNQDKETIMDYQDILKYNTQTLKNDSTLYNLDTIASLSKQEIEKLILKYELPKLPKYNGNKKITTADLNKILENRNLNNIVDINNVIKGIVIKRTNLKSFPTSIHFYDKPGMDNFDNLQESELHVNTPVIITHTSNDNLWSYVITPTYTGWVLKQDIAFASEDDFAYFTNPKMFAIIIKPSIAINSTTLDMSVKLPLLKIDEDYELALPIKGDDGYVKTKKIVLTKEDAHIGYLDYTKENVYNLAFKYLNTPYRWGGMDNGVDCSSYVANIFRTFGFIFPRNTTDQRQSLQKAIDLTNKSNTEKLKLIEGKDPTLLYQPGHVMLYIGTYNRKNYIIHASGSHLKVTLSILDNSDYLKKITTAIRIK